MYMEQLLRREEMAEFALCLGESIGIGLALGFIATGQTGPAVCLLDRDDNVIVELGLDYDWPAAIASAHAVLPRILQRQEQHPAAH